MRVYHSSLVLASLSLFMNPINALTCFHSVAHMAHMAHADGATEALKKKRAQR